MKILKVTLAFVAGVIVGIVTVLLAFRDEDLSQDWGKPGSRQSSPSSTEEWDDDDED